MNKRGFFDIDLDGISPAMLILPLVGFIVGWLTASGGFSSFITDQTYSVSIFTKIFAGLGGAIAGAVWAYYMGD